MPGEFEFKGNIFRFGQMDAIQQIECLSRLLSVGDALKEVLPKALEFARNRKNGSSPDGGGRGTQQEVSPELIATLWDLAGPLARAVAALKSEDKAYLIREAMKLVEIKGENSTGWFKVFNADAGPVGMYQYDWLRTDGAAVLVITTRVLGGTLASFFNIAPQAFARL